MNTQRRTSVIVLITLAELAWLAAFGLLFAYRGKVGELGRVTGELKVATAAQTNLQGLVDGLSKHLEG